MVEEDGAPKYWCPLSELLRRFEIHPREWPVPGAPTPPDHLWTRGALGSKGEDGQAMTNSIGDPVAIGAESRKEFRILTERTKARFPELPEMPGPPPSEKFLVISAMKNEAPFILEWIAYHLAIGVDHFLIYTNDCDDQTDAILDRLQALGFVTRLDNPFKKEQGQRPQRAALNDAASRPEVAASDWYIVIDIDEFINIHVGDGRLPTLVAAMNDPNVISLTWKFFGCGGVAGYDDEFITERFTRCAPEYLLRPRRGWGFKSMVRSGAPFGKIGVHRPLDLDRDRVEEVRWVNGSGRIMPETTMLKSSWRSTKASVEYELATLNHYVLRLAESFLVKRDRGRINHVDHDQGLDYWQARDYATESDERIIGRLPAAKKIWGSLMADAELSRLHQDAVAWRRGRIAALLADPEYRALFDAITSLDRRDAVFIAKLDSELQTG